MGELASRGQVRGAFWRKALVAVPLVLVLGIASGRLSNSGYGNPWFDQLVKPDAMPPGWAFGAAWTVLYVMLGFALALILNARGNRRRASAIGLFVVALALNLVWSPLFFRFHEVTAALWLIAAMFVTALATTLVFARIRSIAGWLLVPYLAWLCFAAALTNDIRRLNPGGQPLAPEGGATQMGAR